MEPSSMEEAMEELTGAAAPRLPNARPKKTSENKDSSQSSEAPSFAQMLKKNLPVQPSPTTLDLPLGYVSAEEYSMSNLTSRVREITGNFPETLLAKIRLPKPNTVRAKKIPKKFIMKYKCGEINPVSALHQFAQMKHVKLDLKETVTTGNVKGYFAFCAVVNGIQYKTGLGQNKKESRSNAAKLALDELLLLEDPEPSDVGTSAHLA
ncbi:adenosine deaminase domain-containing protein 1-like [Trichosurus vulpecula]|uniref:adenosine deaminase domain-containing protein 1-like n=1 Tax=Trichosurus vulpecula TaxID=9337 RepID=UPI00186AD908|nr:adenosine deaminase domain-containing protein 1-like [Trichosurus vulpecula]